MNQSFSLSIVAWNINQINGFVIWLIYALEYEVWWRKIISADDDVKRENSVENWERERLRRKFLTVCKALRESKISEMKLDPKIFNSVQVPCDKSCL